MIRHIGLAGGLGLVLAFTMPGPVAAGPAEVRRAIEKTYGVKVLRISRIKRNKRRLYAVRVMMPGSDDNDAWQVNELLVDPASGRLVSGFQHQINGYGFDGPEERAAPRSDGSRLIRVYLPQHDRSLQLLRHTGEGNSLSSGAASPTGDAR